jgi:PAS domain S-box/PAS domain S-box/PAS domain S-box/PAS domain S-box/PAS domain S-box
MGKTNINPDIKKTFPWRLAVIFLLFSFVIIIMGIYYYRYERNRIFAEQENNLSAIATLKIGQIQQWHSERLRDAFVIRDNRLFIRSIEQYLYDKNAGLKDELLYWMQSVSRGTDYFNVLLTDTTFKVRLSVLKSDTVAGELIEHDLRHALKEQNIIMTDLHRSSYVSNVHMDILVPLSDSVQKKRIPVGVIILRIDPEKTLFPLIQSWPTPSKSSETLLIRKEGDSVMFLNELRHRHNTSLNLSLPLIVSLPASMAANGVTGLVEGVDYRNVPVVAWLANVPGFPWYMVAKTDKEEILSPLKKYVFLIILIVALLVLINASIFGFWIWQQRIKFYRSQLKNEVSLRESEMKFRQTFDLSPIGIVMVGLDKKFLRCNDSFSKSLGFNMKELAGKTIADVTHPEDISIGMDDMMAIAKGELETSHVQKRYLRKDGEIVWGDVLISLIRNNSGEPQYFLAIIQDITESKKIVEALRESEERFRSLYENVTIGIYRTTLEGRIMMANPAMVSMLGFDTFEQLANRNLQQEGYEPDYPRSKFLETIEKDGRIIGLESAWNRRNGKALIVRESANAVRDAKGRILYFDGTVEDITDRKKIEEALRENEKRLREAQDMAHLGFWLWDIKTGEVEWSDEVYKIFCLDPATFKPQINSILELSPWPEENQRDKELINRAIESHNPGTYEQRFMRPDKSIGYYYSTFRGSYDDEGDLISIVGTILDITERKLAEDALRESEDKFKYVFDHSLIAKSITLPSGEINVNRAFCDMLGYQPEELKKMNWADISHPDDIKLTNDSLNLILSGKKDSVRFTKRYIHKNGSIVWADVGTSLRRDANNNPQYFMTSVNDITERKTAEDELLMQSEIMSHMAEAVYLVRMEDGIIVFANSRFEELFGYAPGEMTGKPVSIVNAPTDKSPVEIATEIIGELEKNGFWTGEVLNLKKDGTVFWSHANVAIFDHSKFGKVLVSVQQDITERKNAESQIKKLNEDLENRVIQRTELLEAANKELEAFSYSVSHDLRAPLRSVHGFTKILLEDYEANLDDEGKRICGIISSSATKMGELIDDLLSFSRIGRSTLSSSEIDMKRIAKVVFEGMTSPTERKRIKLNIGKLQKAFGDITLFGQVWTNLISNAIKYSSKNDVSEISIGSKIAGNMIIYFIKDNGVGFDMQYAHKLFGVFQRLHSEADFEGNGVGLAIVQRIILKHGGNVWAEGEEEKGSTFYFSLPAEGDGQRATGK